EPLYCTLLSHKVLLSSLFIDSCPVLRKACASTSPLDNVSRFKSGNVQWPRAPKAKPLTLPEVLRTGKEPFCCASFRRRGTKTSARILVHCPEHEAMAKDIIKELTFLARENCRVKSFFAQCSRSGGFLDHLSVLCDAT